MTRSAASAVPAPALAAATARTDPPAGAEPAAPRGGSGAPVPVTGRLTLHFDGGCRPNPGPMETAVVVRGATRFRDDLGVGDSNDAEWLALLHAAQAAKEAGAQDVLFVGDSALVVGQANGRAKCRSPRLRAHLDAFRAATAGIARVRCRFVPRSKNLAGIALARRRAGAGPPG